MIRPVCLTTLVYILATASAMAGDPDEVGQEALRDAVGRAAPSVVQIETVGGADQVGNLTVGTGPTTGLVVDPEGYIASSSINFAHTPSGILVRLPNGQRHAAQLVATDHNRKISLLKVDTDAPLPVPTFVDPEQVRVGQWSIAVGRAFDPELANLAVGIISALDRVWGKALQTDAAVSPNNYGGALINLQGEVVGLLVPMSPMSDDEVAGVEWYDSGIGFVVPADQLQQAVSRLKTGTDLHAGRIGMTLEKSVAMSGPPVVTSVLPNSPAENAGLEKGDRIVRIGQKNVTRSAEIKYELAGRYAGDGFDMLVRRGDGTIECQGTLVAELEPYRRPMLGILPQRGQQEEPGVSVRLAVPESPAAQLGIVPGDRIVSLDGEPVVDAADLRGRIARRKPDEKISVDVVSGTDRRKIDLVLAPAATSLPDNLPPLATDPDAEPGREVPLALPQWKNKIEAYLPKAYSGDRKPGLLVWMRSTADEPSGLAPWKKHADSRGLIVVLVEPSATERWLPSELELVRDVLQLCKKRFSVDSERIVLGGQAGGGALAYGTVAVARDELSGCIVFDANITRRVVTDRPGARFGLLIGRSNTGRLAERLDRAADLLRKGGVPLVLLPREGAADRLADRDVAAITRWIDLLDQI